MKWSLIMTKKRVDFQSTALREHDMHRSIFYPHPWKFLIHVSSLFVYFLFMFFIPISLLSIIFTLIFSLFLFFRSLLLTLSPSCAAKPSVHLNEYLILPQFSHSPFRHHFLQKSATESDTLNFCQAKAPLEPNHPTFWSLSHVSFHNMSWLAVKNLYDVLRRLYKLTTFLFHRWWKKNTKMGRSLGIIFAISTKKTERREFDRCFYTPVPSNIVTLNFQMQSLWFGFHLCSYVCAVSVRDFCATLPLTCSIFITAV